MILIELFKAIGIDLCVRSFMVDYRDSKGNHFHKSMQTVRPEGQTEPDSYIIASIRNELGQQGFTVSGIHEVSGNYEMQELEQIFNSSEYRKYPVRNLYLNPEKAMQ